MPVDLELALLDPTAVFASPKEVLAAPLSTDDKAAVLRRWAYDARHAEASEYEGMPMPGEQHVLRQVELSLLTLAPGAIAA